MSAASAIFQRLHDDLAAGRCGLLVLSRVLPGAGDDCPTKRTARLLRTGKQFVYQWTEIRGKQAHHENGSPLEILESTRQLLGQRYGDLHVQTKTGSWSVRLRPDGSLRMKTSRAGGVQEPSEMSSPGTLPHVSGHNREKSYLIPAGTPVPFLEAVGLMTPSGQVRPVMYHKFRQINRYLELVDDVLPSLPADGVLRVLDFGCGKSYLTFALYHLLTRIRGRQVEILGLDLKADVMAHCQQLAEQLQLDGLRFETGRIEDQSTTEPVHLAVSLHACDTATDSALAAAVARNAVAILSVPCCQQELQHQLQNPAWDGLLDYGLLRERLASLATDALRAQWLETQGYRTQVLEFIDLEHTAKNVLLRAVRRTREVAGQRDRHREKYLALERALGLKGFRLDAAGAESANSDGVERLDGAESRS